MDLIKGVIFNDTGVPKINIFQMIFELIINLKNIEFLAFIDIPIDIYTRVEIRNFITLKDIEENTFFYNCGNYVNSKL
jgi:hypothetical protein